MLATQSTQSGAPRPPHTINQMECFATAVAMVQNRNRASGRRYTGILFPLVDSFTRAKRSKKPRPNAGGPAIRLAQALWDLDYRMLFPNDKTLIAAEENSGGHFYHFYAGLAEDPYYISQAARAFRNLRLSVLSAFPTMPKTIQPDADATITPLCKALLEMDATVYNAGVPSKIQRNPHLRKIIRAVSNAYPLPEELPLAVIRAVPDLVWYLRAPTEGNFHTMRKHYEELKALQYKHTHQLHIWDTELNEAINLLCSYGRPIAQ